MVRVLLADDQPLIRAGLRMFLEAQPNIEVVGEAADGAEAVELAMRYRPDVVLMDVRMPGMDGVAATRQLVEDTIREDDHLVKVIILTTYHVDDAVYAALRAGASGFLLKDAEPGDLVRAVHAVAAGEAWLDPAVARRLLTDFAARPDALLPPPAMIKQLTAREQEVLILMAHGLSNDEIASHLIVGTTTIKTHVGRIFLKLTVRDRAQAVAVAYQAGLVRPGDQPPPRNR